MKRHMDLVRQILLVVEEHEVAYAPREIEIEGYTKEQIEYHAFIMGEAGLVYTIDTTSASSSGPQAIINRLTWEGHEFLDVAREPSRWESAKDSLEKVGGASIQIWLAVLTDLVKQKLGLSS